MPGCEWRVNGIIARAFLILGNDSLVNREGKIDEQRGVFVNGMILLLFLSRKFPTFLWNVYCLPGAGVLRLRKYLCVCVRAHPME